MKWLTPVIMTGFILIGLAGCQNKKNPLSLELLGKKDLGQEKTVKIDKMDAVKVGTFEGQTAFSSEIFTGKTQDYSSVIFVQFNALSALPDTAKIEKVILRLYSRNVINPERKTDLTLKLYAIKTQWDQKELTNTASLEEYRGEEVGANTVSTQTGVYDSLTISPALVKGWKDSSIENNGVLLEAENEAFIKSYDSYLNEKPPHLLIFYKKGTATDSLFVGASKDVFLVKSTWQPNPDYAYVGEGVDLLTDFRFTLPVLPANSTIHKAVLYLPVDTTASLLGSDRIYSLAKMPLLSADPAPKADSTAIDSASYQVGKDHVTTLITDIVQKWMSGKMPNNGLRLAPRHPGADLFRIAFFTAQVNSQLKPTVTIYYSIPPAK